MINWIKRWFRKEPKSQKMNTIKMLRPWKSGTIWAFDDEGAGLRGEPFVANASELIDNLVKKYKAEQDEEGKINLLFSHLPFPGATKLLLAEDGKGTGVTYLWPEKKLEAWLCPAFYCYFDTDSVPTELYALAA